MKVVYDHQAFNLQPYGGISRYFCELASRLPALENTSVDVIAPLHVSEHLHASQAIASPGLKVRNIPGTNRVRRVLASALAGAVVRRKKGVDIFHETYYSLADHAPAGARRVITVYDMIHERFLKDTRSAQSTIHAKLKAISRADHIICISENTRRDLVELCAVADWRTSVVPLGFGVMECESTQRLPACIDRPYILYVGARGQYKNFLALLGAYASSTLLRQNLAVVCFGGGALSAHEIGTIDSLGIGRDAVIHVAGDDSLLARAYAGAMLFVYPSLYEGFGIPPLEAMSVDCPVVCSRAGSIPEVVGDAAVYFDPLNVDEIRTAMELVVSSPDLRGKLVSAGRNRVALFSWDRCVRQTLDTYKQVLGT